MEAKKYFSVAQLEEDFRRVRGLRELWIFVDFPPAARALEFTRRSSIFHALFVIFRFAYFLFISRKMKIYVCSQRSFKRCNEASQHGQAKKENFCSLTSFLCCGRVIYASWYFIFLLMCKNEQRLLCCDYDRFSTFLLLTAFYLNSAVPAKTSWETHFNTKSLGSAMHEEVPRLI